MFRSASDDNHLGVLIVGRHLEEIHKPAKGVRIDLKIVRWQIRVPPLEPSLKHIEGCVNEVDLYLRSYGIGQFYVPHAIIPKEEPIVEDDINRPAQEL
jgi:hypothetical protein